jgi:glycine/D-amino acid oxidase-like deaminating enzyme
MEKSSAKDSKQYDVIIVGMGCFGLASAYYLSRQGYKVLGFD